MCSRCSTQATPAALRTPRPLLAIHPPPPLKASVRGGTVKPEWSTVMDETARKNAAAALQRALDRRDNGGSTGH